MALSNEAEICGCNGVCKGEIVNAISKQGLFTLEDVRTHTKASSSCGSCTGLVEALLASTVGEGYDASPNAAVRPWEPGRGGAGADIQRVALAAALQRCSSHPYASAFVGGDGDGEAVVEQVETVTGGGVRGWFSPKNRSS